MTAEISYGFPVSVDGYIADATGEIGLPVPEEALHRYFNDLQARTALSLYGRRMYAVMRYWDGALNNSDNPAYELEYARLWQATPKVVVSTTLEEVGPNARLLKTDVERTVRQLKAETNGRIEVGGASLAASLLRLGLVDELCLYVMPVVLGGGKPYFEAGLRRTLEPLGTESLPQGVTLLRYRPI